MVSLIIWLICLLVVVIIVKYILDAVEVDARIKSVVWLVIGLLIFLVILSKLGLIPTGGLHLP